MFRWLTTASVAGVTIVFGIVALGVVEAMLAPQVGDGVGAVAGALAFATGLVFLIVGRTELFTENFFDPVALAGALITLLSYLLNASNTVAARILVAYMVGTFLALDPFDHVVVSALHILFGIWLGGHVGYGELVANLGLATLGNLTGGLFLITFTHAAQVWSERRG